MTNIYTVISEREYDGLSHGDTNMLKCDAIAWIRKELETAAAEEGTAIVHMHIMVRKGKRKVKE